MRHSTGARQSTVRNVMIGAMLLVAFALLAACSGQGGVGGTGSSPTGASGASPSASVTGQGNGSTPPKGSTPTTAPGAFSATVNEQYTTAQCAGTEPKGTICLAATGTGQGAPIGSFTLTRTIVLAPSGQDSCGPTTTEGSFVTSAGDSVSFTAKGTLCRGTNTTTYTYTITGGSGRYKGATGSGTVQIPASSSDSADTQTWSGTLVYAGA